MLTHPWHKRPYLGLGRLLWCSIFLILQYMALHSKGPLTQPIPEPWPGQIYSRAWSRGDKVHRPNSTQHPVKAKGGTETWGHHFIPSGIAFYSQRISRRRRLEYNVLQYLAAYNRRYCGCQGRRKGGDNALANQETTDSYAASIHGLAEGERDTCNCPS
ncbi:hypothetical protein B0I35DRAFT_103650 [Stachybotrys elegans]|uniref:Uncharacterized protein n=1 Tax=Stachybotrys elegans TaxID=80388 RepID=A0A8K0SK76_9HYPO|nr:hypothetical protein B0I35DRAFT_103650 [Stachybotrys elegans]